MLQEEQTVTFQPMYEVYVPWYVRLFYLYLALTILLALVRSARVVWNLRTQRAATQQSENLQDFWDHSQVRARSLKTLSHLTFFDFHDRSIVVSRRCPDSGRNTKDGWHWGRSLWSRRYA
jgi:hypothetical protein